AGVEENGVGRSAPDDHFSTGPYCRVIGSGSGRVVGDGSCPAIRAGIVSTAGVRIELLTPKKEPSPPDDHFTASPHCRMTGSGGGVGECGWSPSVVDAATRRTSYYRKRVVCAHCRHCH